VTEEERIAAGRVTQEAYAEFAPNFERDDWNFYARTLPDTRPRVEQGTLLIAIDDSGEVVGTVTLYLVPKPTSGHWRPEDAVFRFLAVLPDRRRSGIGNALFRECISRSVAAGRRRVALQTTTHMTAAQEMYLRAGFARDPDGDQIAGSFSLLGYALTLEGQHGPDQSTG
jgi:ribosomal protein S18 acetylase RimI-like enzyme